MLGHRRRLLLDSVLRHVVAPHRATLFAYLENGTMWTPYLKQGGEILEHPAFRSLSDAQLRSRLGALVRAAGGLHQWMGHEGALITDSGGFQVFSLAHGSVHNDVGALNSDASHDEDIRP